MAILTRRSRRDEEEESVFVSMTDLMISILFIVMILMAFFAKSFSTQETVPLERHQREISSRDDVIADLKDANEALTTENEDLKNQIGELESSLTAKQTLIAQLLRENDLLRQKLDSLVLSESELRERYAEASVEIENLRAVNERLRLENEGLRSEIATLELELENDETQEARIEALRADNMRLREIIALLEQSHQIDERLSNALENISETRRQLLSTIQGKLLDAGIKVEVDEVSGVIRFERERDSF